VVAGSTSRPAELSSTVFRPRWAGWRPRYPEVVSGPSPGPWVAPAARLQLPGRVRGVAGLGHGGVAAGVRGVLDSWLPAAVPGRLCAAVHPAVGGLSTAESGGSTPWWTSESVCLYRKPLADSSSWMRGLTCRSASLGGLEAAIPGGGLRAISRASGGALCPAQRHRPGPVRGDPGGASRRRRRKSSRLPSQSSDPCLSSRKFQSRGGVLAAVCKHPAAANRCPECGWLFFG
jgi:hypothetical protein